MKIVEPSSKFESLVKGDDILRNIEQAGRTCYKSDCPSNSEEGGNTKAFVKSLIDRGHHSVLEHQSVSVRIICDRGVSHEIVRHRLASYSQESTRYCNYSQAKFGNQITVIDPRPYIPDDLSFSLWKKSMADCEEAYFALLKMGILPQMARSVLPNSLKTEIVMTCNLREWRHFFTLRTAPAAHPQMKQIARPLLSKFRQLILVVFDDVGQSK